MPQKNDYITRINSLRTISSTKTPDVVAEDLTRATAAGISVETVANVEADATIADLPSSVIKGQEIKDAAVAKMTAWSTVRKIKYVLTGAGTSYDKYAHVISPVPSYGGPTQSSPIFNSLNPGQPISITNFDNIIADLGVVLTGQTEILEHTIDYCHSSCHSNCHVSRGRR